MSASAGLRPSTPRHWECQEKKNVRLTLSMNLSSMTAPDYGKMCPNFCYREIQFNQSQAWTWSYLRASHCLWSNERPGICYLLISPVPEVRTHLPIIRDCHGAQIHWWFQPDIFFLLAFSMTRRVRARGGAGRYLVRSQALQSLWTRSQAVDNLPILCKPGY